MNDYFSAMREYVAGDSLGNKDEILSQGLSIPVCAPKYPGCGVVLWSDAQRMIVSNSDAHSIIVSGTGGGKTESEVKQLVTGCIRAGESLLVTDTKSGELYELAYPYLKEQGYQQVYVLNFVEPHRSNRWNPLHLPALLMRSDHPVTRDIGETMFTDFADMVFQKSKHADPFWDDAAKDMLISHFYFLLDHADLSQINLGSIARMHGESKEEKGKIYKMIFSDHVPPGSIAAIAASTRITAPLEGTAPSIDTVFASKINQIISSEARMRMFCHNDIDFMALDSEKVAIFLLLPDSSPAWDVQASLLIHQVYQQLVRLCTLRHNGHLPYRFNMIFEEFGNLNIGRAAGTIFSAARSRNIRITAVIQNFSQLVNNYGQDVADTIRYNAPNWIYMHTRDIHTLETLSKLCGIRTYTTGSAEISCPVASVAQLQGLPMGQALVFYGRNRPFVTDLAPYFSFGTGVQLQKVSYPSNLAEPIPQFSYKEFLRDAFMAKQKREMDMMRGVRENVERMTANKARAAQPNEKKTPHQEDLNVALEDLFSTKAEEAAPAGPGDPAA